MFKKTVLLCVLVVSAALSACRSTPVKPIEPVYWVEGAVSHVGKYDNGGDTTLLEAIRIAQPLDGVSDLAHVQLSRTVAGEAVSWVVDVQHMLATGDTTDNVLMQAGDVVLVPGGEAR